MILNEAIFIFTKDRPEVLRSAICSINELNSKKYIIDDSFHEVNRIHNKELVLQSVETKYFGQKEFDEFIYSLHIDTSKVKLILRKLGNLEWNLGYARNFALLFSIFNHIENVLFMDDDITIHDLNLIPNTFILLENFDFVGANIAGMIDDSIIGFLSNDLGILDTFERTLSGGFLAFKPKKVRMPFINVYNEDWIWLFLHSKETKHLQLDGVYQQYSNPYLGYKEKILFQEIGEIIITGIVKLKEEDNFALLTTDIFWLNILEKRQKYLTELGHMAERKEKTDLLEIISWLQEMYSELNSQLFLTIFKLFCESRLMFKKLLVQVDS